MHDSTKEHHDHAIVPIVPLEPNDRSVISSVIAGYLPYLRQQRPPPLHAIHLLSIVGKKLTPLLKPVREQTTLTIALTIEETEALIAAIESFRLLIPRLAAPSPERDETMQALQVLGEAFKAKSPTHLH
jgi:hypothetical protein